MFGCPIRGVRRVKSVTTLKESEWVDEGTRPRVCRDGRVSPDFRPRGLVLVTYKEVDSCVGRKRDHFLVVFKRPQKLKINLVTYVLNWSDFGHLKHFLLLSF